MHSASKSVALPFRMLMFEGSTSTCEKKCLYMKEWYDSGWSLGKPTYSSWIVHECTLIYNKTWILKAYHVEGDDILKRDVASLVSAH